MTFTDQLDQWVRRNRRQLDELGRLTYQRSTDDRFNHSAHVGIENDSRFAELIVWDSGEVEFAYGSSSGVKDEHHDLTSPNDLDELLESLVRRLRP
jgi:hypothetical protein